MTCAKFVTTPDYTPRLQARLEVEQQLVQDADERGWTREVERHTAVARRLQALLADLGETTGHTEVPACKAALAAALDSDQFQSEDDSAGSAS
ncbi:hypothetical protein ACTMTF_48730 [Nonomuraea sp. ZG12]|uniref:hypothetical protein n=1 Tax=Nonomuraea sp. ZG12 TaxID=3452207 RepID=UPI003F8AC126